MTALTKDKASRNGAWTKRPFTLASGYKAYKNGLAGLNITTGKVQPMAANPSLLFIGKFERSVDASTADKICTVHFFVEKYVEWLAQDGSIDVTKLGHLASIVDDQTVALKSLSPSASPDAGG